MATTTRGRDVRFFVGVISFVALMLTGIVFLNVGAYIGDASYLIFIGAALIALAIIWLCTGEALWTLCAKYCKHGEKMKTTPEEFGKLQQFHSNTKETTPMFSETNLLPSTEMFRRPKSAWTTFSPKSYDAEQPTQNVESSNKHASHGQPNKAAERPFSKYFLKNNYIGNKIFGYNRKKRKRSGLKDTPTTSTRYLSGSLPDLRIGMGGGVKVHGTSHMQSEPKWSTARHMGFRSLGSYSAIANFHNANFNSSSKTLKDDNLDR